MHVGKTIPTTSVSRISFTPFILSYPPRFLKYGRVPTATPVGTIPLAWDIPFVISEACEPSPTHAGWFYRVINPNDSDLTIEFDEWLEDFTPGTPTDIHYRMRINIKFKDAGAVVWEASPLFFMPGPWTNSSSGGIISSNQPPVPMADWTELRWSFRPAVWADVPWYHPYRA